MRLLSGLRAWSVQSITALYLLAYLLAAVLGLWSHGNLGYVAWRHFMSQPAVSVATLLFFSALMLHIWVGLRDVILDYVQPLIVRAVLLGAIACTLVALEGWVLIALARV